MQLEGHRAAGAALWRCQRSGALLLAMWPPGSAAGDQDPGGPWHRLVRSPDRVAVVPAPSCVFPACSCSSMHAGAGLCAWACVPLGPDALCPAAFVWGFAADSGRVLGGRELRGCPRDGFAGSLAGGRRLVLVVLWRRGARTGVPRLSTVLCSLRGGLQPGCYQGPDYWHSSIHALRCKLHSFMGRADKTAKSRANLGYKIRGQVFEHRQPQYTEGS